MRGAKARTKKVDEYMCIYKGSGARVRWGRSANSLQLAKWKGQIMTGKQVKGQETMGR